MLIRAVCRTVLMSVLYSVAASGVVTAQTRQPSVKQEGVHAVLLVASATGNAKYQGALPPSVAKALQDASQFLPFTVYELLDQVSLRGAGVEQRIRLRGYDAREYQLTVSTHPSTDSPDRVAVRVSLAETTPPQPLIGASEVMTTEYSARVGETVVVGTSKIKSGATEPSLVLLVTLIPAP